MTGAVDPDPDDLAGERETAGFGGREEPATGDPTAGGRHGDVGTTDSIAEDEPDDGTHYAPGGGNTDPEPQQPPHAGPDGT